MTLAEHLRAAEQTYMRQVLIDCGWNVSRAARIAGCHRDWVYRLMKRHSLTPPPNTPTRKPHGGNSAWRALGA